MAIKKIAAAAFAVTGLVGAWLALSRRNPIGNDAVPEPARPVELYRYMGRWYEQFRYDSVFEQGLDDVTAEYTLEEDGSVTVVNRGRPDSRGDDWRETVGKAKVIDEVSRAKLKVSFFGPFYGNYWILDHGEGYDWAIVGEPSGRYLWVLTRVVHPSATELEDLEHRVAELGYDLRLMRRTRQQSGSLAL